MKYLKDNHGWNEKIKIIHTGFSLGGFIAAACVLENFNANNIYAVTFDSPGYDFLVVPKININQKEKYIVNYVAYPNLVNTCQKHIGKIIQIFKPMPTDENVTITTTELLNTLFNHKRELFVKTLSEGINLYPASDWPRADFVKNNVLTEIFKQFEITTDDNIPQVAEKLYKLLKNINYNRKNKVNYEDY